MSFIGGLNKNYERFFNLPYGSLASSNSLNPLMNRKTYGSNVISASTAARRRNLNYNGDRFIPNRAATNMNFAQHWLSDNADLLSINKGNLYQQCLKDVLFGSGGINSSLFGARNSNPISTDNRIFAYSKKIPEKTKYADQLRSSFNIHQSNFNKRRIAANKNGGISSTLRHIDSTPLKILDAPELVNDYYLNTIDYGGSSDLLAVALGPSVYLYSIETEKITELFSVGDPEAEEYDDYICSVQWRDNYLAVGISDSTVQIWDATAEKKLRTFKTHEGRVGALSWNKTILTTGSQDSTIQHHDTRSRQHLVNKITGAHNSEVCGLKWSPDGTKLASGGNDNKVNIFGNILTDSTPKFTITKHTDAVKALAWCPWDNSLLASGGGAKDKKIHFWNTNNGCLLKSKNTGSQVTSLVWSSTTKEILSGHGNGESNIKLWSYPSLKKLKVFNGHNGRVLQLVKSEKTQQIVSVGADESVRFWNMFPQKDSIPTSGVGGTRRATGSNSVRSRKKDMAKQTKKPTETKTGEQKFREMLPFVGFGIR